MRTTPDKYKSVLSSNIIIKSCDRLKEVKLISKIQIDNIAIMLLQF